jgi:hypothetical protein
MYARAPSAVQVIVAQANRNAGRLYRRAGGHNINRCDPRRFSGLERRSDIVNGQVFVRD